EVAQQRQPVRRGLLGVELDAEERIAVDGGDERLAVLACAQYVGRLSRTRREAVHVVEGLLAGKPRGERRVALAAHEVPADVRKLAGAGVELRDGARQQPEAGGAAQLHRGV